MFVKQHFFCHYFAYLDPVQYACRCTAVVVYFEDPVAGLLQQYVIVALVRTVGVVVFSTIIQVQGDRLNMAVCFWYLVKVTYLVYTCTVAYTGQVIFSKVPPKTRPCSTGHSAPFVCSKFQAVFLKVFFRWGAGASLKPNISNPSTAHTRRIYKFLWENLKVHCTILYSMPNQQASLKKSGISCQFTKFRKT